MPTLKKTENTKAVLADARAQGEGESDYKNQVSLCIPVINKFLPTKTKRSSPITSYGLKHIFEDVLGTYICNGAAIEAMVRSGFTGKQTGRPIKGTEYDYCFNFSMRECRLLEAHRVKTRSERIARRRPCLQLEELCIFDD